jgi:hypothetical protein
MDAKPGNMTDKGNEEDRSLTNGYRTPENRDQSIKIAQQILRKYIKEGVPLVDDFIKARRNEAELD